MGWFGSGGERSLADGEVKRLLLAQVKASTGRMSRLGIRNTCVQFSSRSLCLDSEPRLRPGLGDLTPVRSRCRRLENGGKT